MHQLSWSKVRAQGIASKAVDASASEVVGETAGAVLRAVVSEVIHAVVRAVVSEVVRAVVDASASEVLGEAAGELVVDTERGRDQCGRYQRRVFANVSFEQCCVTTEGSERRGSAARSEEQVHEVVSTASVGAQLMERSHAVLTLPEQCLW